jgi:hypothetical protein
VLRSALGRLERAQAPLVMLDLLAHAELLANRVAHLVDGAHDRDELRRDVHLGLGLAPLEAVEEACWSRRRASSQGEARRRTSRSSGFRAIRIRDRPRWHGHGA